MENEEFYDKEIAPVLLQLRDKCFERGIAMVCAVEYERGNLSRTMGLPDGCTFAMRMINHCAKTAPNIDSYIIGLMRYARENRINLDGSMIMRRIKYGY